MKNRILDHLITNSPAKKSAISIGVALGAQSEKEASTSVMNGLDSLIREKLIFFEFDKETKTFYYSVYPQFIEEVNNVINKIYDTPC